MYLTLYANENGEILEHPDLGLLGRSGGEWVVPEDEEMIPLPLGASLVKVPYHIPVGIDIKDRPACLESNPVAEQERAWAVAALLPQGFTRTLLPACVRVGDRENGLPLFAYTAVGLKQGKIYAAAVQSDQHRKWHPCNYNTDGLPAKIARILKKFPQNRIVRQLARCSLEYSCYTAQNIFYQRWEAGIPTMNACNAACLACISESRQGVDSPQNRLDFRPSVDEIAELAAGHLLKARDAIVSFGQGCEGEPSLNAADLSAAIRKIRAITDQGTINMNSNAGYTEGIRLMCDAGLDSMRVTIFSCAPDNYQRYHCPRDYRLNDVEHSIAYAKDHGLKVSLNLLTYPGFTDREDEIEYLLNFVQKKNIDMIQLRNLNMDPDILQKKFANDSQGMGIVNFINLLKEELPDIKIGSYSYPLR